MSLFESNSVYKELKDAKIISDVTYNRDDPGLVTATFYLNPLPKNG